VSWTTPRASPTRAQIETASRSLLVRLHDLPRWVIFVGVVVLAVGGAVLRSWPAATCLVVIGALIGWLLYLAWPSLDPVKRAVRLAAVTAVLAAAVAKVIIG